MDNEDNNMIDSYQNEYFNILSEFFLGVTGTTPEKFCSPSEFGISVDTLGKNLKDINSIELSYQTLIKKLQKLYTEKAVDYFKVCKNIKACKVNLGGGSRFLETQLNATKKSMLISDIVMIPDPVMPFIESEMKYNKFNFVELLQAAYFILHLKNLISEDFDLPPFLIFPSFEKSLEENDEQTQQFLKSTISGLFSYGMGEDIKFDELYQLVTSEENRFMSVVNEQQLFIAPGGKTSDPLIKQIEIYTEHIKEFRTEDFSKIINQFSDGELVFNGILERVNPHCHLLENSFELNSSPLVCIDAQAHYFKLIGEANNNKVENVTGTNKNMPIQTSALMNTSLDFLTNISDEQLLMLRKTDENIIFRNKLREYTSSFSEAELNNIDFVTSEVCQHIQSLISEHKKEVYALNCKYNKHHVNTLLAASGALVVTMCPALLPFLGGAAPITGIGAGVKYANDKAEEIRAKKILSNSMMGVFALAKDKD